MRAVGLAFALAGCNQVYGLSKPGLVDGSVAPFFDAPADAPFACPPLGGTLQFSSRLNQIDADCGNYTESEDGVRATAIRNGLVVISDDHQAFAPLAAVTVPMVSDPRLAPEGDELFVISTSTPSSTIEAYHRDATTQLWQHDYTVNPGLPLSMALYIGAPTRGPLRRMMISNYAGINFQISEIEFDASSGRVVHTYTNSELGIIAYYAPYLSPDGLRMYYTQRGAPLRYYDRPDLATPFTSPRDVLGPEVDESFMTADCARLYVYSSDLRSLFWTQQL